MIWSEFLTDRPLSEEEIRTACAALLAAVGIGAGLSFLAALLIAGVVLAVGFVILEVRARWEEYAAQHGTPVSGRRCRSSGSAYSV